MIKNYFLLTLLMPVLLIAGCISEKKITLKEIGVPIGKVEIEQMIKEYKSEAENKNQDVKLMFVKKLNMKKEEVYYLAYIDEYLPNPAGETFNSVIVSKSDLKNKKINKDLTAFISKKEIKKIKKKVEFSYY
ncbi:hypothetical protein CKN73_06895 [Carnobacterium divergens]|uniref:hypothetical protein n=1 Tax=Carnobacterium divergens TaxID=2748 RepID=UPI001071C4DE|nr:hypothetical protein [Carnobacterium divergens]TFJ40721.1 hypothetical protein CKN77_07020 [Carnobacterium divergens]TFJ49409.1 hypothetical protein CKN73_06895 [Carnobacterium divergens]TFJ54776.1 hypothetical protein CKN83_06825 [Carnobacterium divergens]TFJ60987.1 hypothetical protein CKN89_07205 [Carnobacterium divergens]TFJ71127.1 hypothetical protein CKN91_06830 [Carnobacterium divergens]